MMWIVFLLALAGLANALYFALSYYGLLRAHGRLIPTVEARNRCQTVMETPDGRVFGLPNFIFGILYYLALIALSFMTESASGWATAAAVTSWFTVLLGVYLVHALFFKIRVSCPLCMVGHGINLALAVCLTVVST